SVPDVLVTKARMFTLASPSTLAIWARVPGRFSQETVNCFVFGMGSYLLECALYICGAGVAGLIREKHVLVVTELVITSDCPIVDIAHRLTAESPVASPKNKIKVANLTLPLSRGKHFSRKEGLMNINRLVGAVVGVRIVRAALNWT